MSRVVALATSIALVAATACSRAPSDAERQAHEREIAALTAEADALQERLTGLIAADPRRAGLPQGDVVIAVPTAFLEQLVDRVFTDVASRVTLTLSGIRAHKKKTLKKGITLGDFEVNILVEEVKGRLAPGTPAVRFGRDSVSLELPVEVIEGEGEATVHLLWNGRGAAGAVCGDLDVTERVSGSAKPVRKVLSGTLAFEARGAEIVGTPRFPETKVRLRVKPSASSWAKIDAILAGKREGLCGWVLDRVDVKKIVAKEVEQKGFDVKLPLHKIKPFRFPAGLSESVTVRDRPLSLEVKASELRIDEAAVWVGARVAVRGDAAPPVAGAPGPATTPARP